MEFGSGRHGVMARPAIMAQMEPIMRNSCQGKVAIITGGSSGIGYALAERLIALEAKVVLTGRDAARVSKATQALGPSAIGVLADATDPTTWQAVIDAAQTTWGRLDIFVANHGAGVRIAPLEEQDDASIAAAIAINLTSVIQGCRAVLPILRAAQGGHIVTLGSACTYHSWPQWSAYTAAKAGLAGFTRCLHLEMQPWGGKASIFCPGATRSGFQAAAGIAGDMAAYPSAEDMADILLTTINIPKNMIIEDTSAWGTAQVLTPY